MAPSDIGLTAKQYIALRAYYVEGMSHAAISRTLMCSRQNTQMLVSAARAKMIRAYEDGVIDIRLLVEGLLRPSPTSNVTRDLGTSASRRERLLDALELRMQQRALESRAIAECMSGSSFVPTHIKRNSFDQWEMRYLNERQGRGTVPSAAYRAANVAGHCACDWHECGLACAGCYGGCADAEAS
jgi:hypothetical protein